MTWKPSSFTRQQLEERRLAGGRLLKAGRLTQAEIARRLGVSRAAVSDWAFHLKAGGEPQLYGRRPSGRPPKLTRRQQQALLRRLQRGALSAGFPTDRWTLRRVQQLIKDTFGVHYHPCYLNRWLRKAGWTPQVPLPCAIEQDEELVQAWLAHDWPRIKKSVATRRRNRLFR